MLKDFMYLAPLWSIFFVSKFFNIEDFQFSNTAIESYFKTLKTGNLNNKLRIRPANFLKQQLIYLRGKINFNNIPPKSTKRRLDEVTEEKWHKKCRKGKHYKSTATAQKIFKRGRIEINISSNDPVSIL